jgi:solute carrier family 10 (sodium/bile acid cotransporter), member 7
MYRRQILDKLIPDKFVLALLATLLLAAFLPARGAWTTLVGAASTVMIVLLFFFVGAKLSRSAIVAGLRHWRLHVTVLACTFVMFPLIGLVLARTQPGLLPAAMWIGILYICALPSTVQSSIAFTSIAGGNVAAAVAAASASQLIGVVFTPVLIGILAGTHGLRIPLAQIGSLCLQILLPFLVGHLARPWIGTFVEKRKLAISRIDRGTILIAVYAAFSAATVAGLWQRVDPTTLAIVCAICAGMLSLALLVTALLGKALGFAREDRIVLQFCGTKKSLVQGVPMAKALFIGPDLGMILLPIMIFHQLQLMACAFIAQRYATQTKGSHDVH